MNGYLIAFAVGAAFMAGILIGRFFERMEVVHEKAHVPPRPLPAPAATRPHDQQKAG